MQFYDCNVGFVGTLFGKVDFGQADLYNADLNGTNFHKKAPPLLTTEHESGCPHFQEPCCRGCEDSGCQQHNPLKGTPRRPRARITLPEQAMPPKGSKLALLFGVVYTVQCVQGVRNSLCFDALWLQHCRRQS